MPGGAELFRLREEYIPVVRLYELFGVEPDSRAVEDGLLVVVEAEGRRFGVLVDDLLAQQQVVIKSLETNFRQVRGVAGATILGDGTVALIIDVPGLVQVFNESLRAGARSRHEAAAATRNGTDNSDGGLPSLEQAMSTGTTNGDKRLEAAEDAGQYLTFQLGREEYAVDILRVQEIKGWERATPHPARPGLCASASSTCAARSCRSSSSGSASPSSRPSSGRRRS